MEYRNLITKVRASEDVPVILVANKVDLEQTNRAVDVREGEALADKFSCPFYETSAAHRRHVDDVFHSLVREIRQVENNAAIFQGNIIIYQNRKRNEDVDFIKPETKWRKVWNNIFKKIRPGRKKI